MYGSFIRILLGNIKHAIRIAEHLSSSHQSVSQRLVIRGRSEAVTQCLAGVLGLGVGTICSA